MKPLKEYGYNAVGPGWRPLLELLDSYIVNAVENAVANANSALPQHKREGNTPDAKVEILQVKEKLGGLRVYFQAHGMESDIVARLQGAAAFAESMSYRTCEKCGSTENVETRAAMGNRPSWSQTLCPEHHKERDASYRLQQSEGMPG